MCFMLNIVGNNKYILEIETVSCILILVYKKNREGLKDALLKVESFLGQSNYISAKILCSNSKQEVWCNFRAN